MSRYLLICLIIFALAGCAAKGGVQSGKSGKSISPSSASELDMRDTLRQVLKENPNLVMDVLAENKIELSTIVEEGFMAKRKKARDDRMAQELDDPLEPSIDESRPMLGEKDAPVTIVEYTDFQCPYCSQAADTIREVVEKNPGTVRVFFKHVPLHDMSLKLALYFEALAMQDQAKAWKFHDLAFAHRKELAEDKEKALGRILNEVNPDMARFEKDLQDVNLQARVESDIREAQEFGFRGTPVFVVNGVSVVGAQPEEEFQRVIGLVQTKAKADSKSAPAKQTKKDAPEDCPTCLSN